MIIQVKHIMW